LVLGQCCENLREPDKQYEAYERAYKLDPSSVAANLGKARALEAMNRPGEAVAFYQAGTDKAGNDLVLARVLIRQTLQKPPGKRNWKEVEEVLDRLEKTPPKTDDEAVQRTLLRAEVLANQGQIDRAKDRVLAEHEKHAQSVELWLALIHLTELQKK